MVALGIGAEPGSSGLWCSAHPLASAAHTRTTDERRRRTLSMTTTRSCFGNRALPAAGDKRADIGQRDRPFPRRLIGHVTREPDGIELLFVVTDALKVVPLLAA